MLCGRCGAWVKDGARFCGTCGADLRAVGTVAETQPQQEAATTHQKALIAVLLGVLGVLVILVGVLVGMRVFSRNPQVSVVVPLEVPGLDNGGTHVPVEVEGTDQQGNAVKRIVYLLADGSGLSLAPGTYEVWAVGSPIADDGTIYSIPDVRIKVVLNDEAIEAGEAAPVPESLSYVPIEAGKVTDEQIEEALKWAHEDDSLDGTTADHLAEVTRENRTGAEQREEEERKEREANTVHVGQIAFVIPEAWRGKASIKNVTHGINVTYNNMYILSVDSGPSDSFYWNKYPARQTITLSNGNTLEFRTNLDDGGVAGRIIASDGMECNLVTIRYDGKEFGGPHFTNGDSSIGREAQAMITDLDPSSDPQQLAFECLRVCAENISFT